MIYSAYAILAIISTASAFPTPFNVVDVPAPIFIPSWFIPNASRSPCPLLNTLANQGFISRDGLNLSVEEITSGIVNATNIDPDFILGFTQSAFSALGVSVNGTINLVDLDAHDETEHDASITRLDLIQGETLTVQPSMVQDLINDAPKDLDYLNTTSIGLTRARRNAESQALGSPPLPAGLASNALGEAGLILLLFGQGNFADPDSLQAPKWMVQQWFDWEVFPLGWQKSPTVLSVANDLDPIVGQIVSWQTYWEPLI